MNDKPGKSGIKHARATDAVHAGRNPKSAHGFVNAPVYRGSTVLFDTLEKLETRAQPYTYGRRGTPTTQSLESSICTMEGGAKTVLTCSGLAAVSTALLSFVEAGDDILMTDSVYQPTRNFCDGPLRRLGVTTTYYDPLVAGGIKDLIKANTRLVFTESPGSQTFELQDIPAIAKATREVGKWVLMDNTWASPLYCNAFDLGADVSIQAATKYIVGHADAMLGAVTANERAARYIERMWGTSGMCSGTEETYLGSRGMRTIDVRLERHMRSGLEIARWLEGRPEISRILHPGLESHPGHELWKRDFSGASGLFGAVLKPVNKPALAAFVDDLELFGMGYSWGGFESLVLPFDPRSYRTATTWDDPGQALRFHIGLEDTADLKADLEAGFDRLNAAS